MTKWICKIFGHKVVFAEVSDNLKDAPYSTLYCRRCANLFGGRIQGEKLLTIVQSLINQGEEEIQRIAKDMEISVGVVLGSLPVYIDNRYISVLKSQVGILKHTIERLKEVMER